MHALIVVAHPDRDALTHRIAAQITQGVRDSGPGHHGETADLAAEGFDPRFTAADVAVHRRQAPPPIDVAAEQARIDRADALVLVYPVYWWSMPALLKGWIERVFANGWAYDEPPQGPLTKKLQRLRVHLVGVAGVGADTYARHGYDRAMQIQIDHGIFDFCGACVLRSELLFDSHMPDPAPLLSAARAIGRDLADADARCEVLAA